MSGIWGIGDARFDPKVHRPDPVEAMETSWFKGGFHVDEIRVVDEKPRAVWLRCRRCRASVKPKDAREHQEERCVVIHPDPA